MRTIRWMAVGLAMVFSLNAAAGLFDDEEARKDLKNLRALLEQQSRDNELRFQKLDDSIKNIGIIQLLNQIESQNAEIARLRGQVEVLANQNEQLTKRQKDFYLDIDTRLRKLEGGPADAGAAPAIAPGAVTAAPVSPAPAPAAAVAPLPAKPVNKEQESKAYDVGATQFRRGEFAAAIRAFEAFKADYPASVLSPNAQYWIGISHFNLKDFANARSAQEALLKTYPDSPKVPDALLAIASAQSEMGESGQARNTLQDIIARFPGTEAATKARARLTQLRR